MNKLFLFDMDELNRPLRPSEKEEQRRRKKGRRDTSKEKPQSDAVDKD